MPVYPDCPFCEEESLRNREPKACQIHDGYVPPPRPEPAPIYVAAEPVEVTIYRDAQGENHETREDAIYANFRHDLNAAMAECVGETHGTIKWHARSLELMAERHPCMLRVLLGDRDAT